MFMNYESEYACKIVVLAGTCAAPVQAGRRTSPQLIESRAGASSYGVFTAPGR
jgi:hypothetical protein